jgi:DNA-binding MarR family transcriptional regulator
MPSTEPVASTLQAWVEVFMRHSMRNFIRYARQSGLSVPQIGALLHIQRENCSGVSNLGDHLGVTSAAASQMLERLVQQGLISRTEDPNDRRVKQLLLTDKGKQILHESIRARQGWLDDLSEALSPSEQEQVNTALQLLIEKTAQLEPSSEIIN